MTLGIAGCAVGLLQLKTIACEGKQGRVCEWHTVLNLRFSFMWLRNKDLCIILKVEK